MPLPKLFLTFYDLRGMTSKKLENSLEYCKTNKIYSIDGSGKLSITGWSIIASCFDTTIIITGCFIPLAHELHAKIQPYLPQYFFLVFFLFANSQVRNKGKLITRIAKSKTRLNYTDVVKLLNDIILL